MMKKLSVFAALLVAVMVAFSSLPAAWGYFTTYTQARGGLRLDFANRTEIYEEVSDMTKHLTIQNFEDSSPVFVRARGFSDSSHPLTYSAPDGGWEDGGDGFWYYTKPLQPGETTTKLDVKINLPTGEPEEGDQFNVVVVYESTLALYDADGNPYADWSVILDTHEEGA